MKKPAPLFIFSAMFLLLGIESAMSQVGFETSPPVSNEELRKYPPGLGDYGKWHGEAHEKGVVAKLRERTKKTCCDNIGECRSTVIKMTPSGAIAILERRWCRVDVKIVYDIQNLPGGWALVCASKSLNPNGCPTVYCAADEPKM